MAALIIGLTGGIGSGKSTVAALFQEFGVPVIDTDAIARNLTSSGKPALQAIAQQFGADMLTPDGALNRAKLRALVFENAGARKQLEAILHPLIRAEVMHQLTLITAPYAIIMVPLLVETGGYREVMQRMLVVDCDEALQLARATQRDKLTAAEVRAVMAAQAPRDVRRAQADDILENNGDLRTLRAAVAALHQRYLQRAQRA